MSKFKVGDLVFVDDNLSNLYKVTTVHYEELDPSAICYSLYNVKTNGYCLKPEKALRLLYSPSSRDESETREDDEYRTSTREEVLNDAKKCICGDRDRQYGAPENNFTIIADLWTTYLHEHMYSPKCELKPVDVANMMCLFKLGRITTSHNGGTYDSYVDLAGYAACAAEVQHETGEFFAC